jgi:heptosyltransferase-2
MTTPALSALRAACPKAEIVLLVNPLVAPLFDCHPAIDRVLVYERKGRHQGLRGFLRMVAELRREHFDAAVLLQNAIEAALLVFAARIPYRGGYPTDARRLFLTDAAELTSADKALHHTEYYLTLLRRLGLDAQNYGLSLQLTRAEQLWAQDFLKSDNVIAVNPGAAYGSAKRWFPERFAAVADTLAERCGATILLTGGPGEHEIGEDIAAFMQHDCINMVGRTNVRQMMALLNASRLLITNDSGPMHVAAAFDVPIVAIFGSTDHTTTSPVASKIEIVRKEVECAPCLLRQCPTDHRCMKNITSDDVITAAFKLLGKVDEDSDR